MDDETFVNWLKLAEEVVKTDILNAFAFIDQMPVDKEIKYDAFKLYLMKNYALNTYPITKED